MFRLLLFCLTLCSCCSTVASTRTGPLQVLMISPSYQADPFFSQVDTVAAYAADSLGFELTLLHGDGNRLFQKQILQNYLKERKPDYLILQVYPGTGQDLFEYLHQQQIPTITLEHILLDKEQQLVGRPGEKYPYWIGEIYHDNQQAGQLLMQQLLRQCQPASGSGLNEVVGINGAYGFESDQRAAGASTAVKASPQFKMQQIVNANWVQDVAYTQTLQLLRRYPQSRVIWSASDWMALGVIDALRSQQLEPADFCIGGFDWIPAAIDKIRDGELTASVGGHFLMAAWAMVAIYDHQQGQLPAGLLSNKPAFALELLTRDNLRQYQPLLQLDSWKQLDFRQFSFSANPTQQQYPFSLQRALQIKAGRKVASSAQ